MNEYDLNSNRLHLHMPRQILPKFCTCHMWSAFVLMTGLVLVPHLLFQSLTTRHFCLYFQYAFDGITNGLQRQPRHDDQEKLRKLSLSMYSCFQNTVYQDPAHLYNYSTIKCLHFNHLTLSRHICSVQKRLIWFYAVMFWCDSLMIVPCRLKHVGI